jgi:hypothetical protein
VDVDERKPSTLPHEFARERHSVATIALAIDAGDHFAKHGVLLCGHRQPLAWAWSIHCARDEQSPDHCGGRSGEWLAYIRVNVETLRAGRVSDQPQRFAALHRFVKRQTTDRSTAAT